MYCISFAQDTRNTCNLNKMLSNIQVITNNINHHFFILFYFFSSTKSFWRIPVSGVADVSVVGEGEGATSRCKSGVSPACLLDSVSTECPSPESSADSSCFSWTLIHSPSSQCRTVLVQESGHSVPTSFCGEVPVSVFNLEIHPLAGQFSVVVVFVVTDEELSRGCTKLQGCHPLRISLFVFCLFQQSFSNLWSPDHLPVDIEGKKWS